MTLTPEQREQKLRAQETFVMRIEHAFVGITQHIAQGDEHIKDHQEKLHNLEKIWHDAKNEIATKQHNFERKLERLKGLSEEEWESHVGEVESAFHDFQEACTRGIAHTKAIL